MDCRSCGKKDIVDVGFGRCGDCGGNTIGKVLGLERKKYWKTVEETGEYGWHEDNAETIGYNELYDKKVVVDVGAIAKFLYKNQPGCLFVIAKERRAEACWDIAQAISTALLQGSIIKGEI